jgi:ATP-dependent Clp protease ATP-binding subunit ClpA
MLEANEGLEKIFEDAVKEAEKRKHEYVTIEHVLLSLVKDQHIGTVLHDFKVNVGALIKDVEDYLDTKCNDIISKGTGALSLLGKQHPGETDEQGIHTGTVPGQTGCEF